MKQNCVCKHARTYKGENYKYVPNHLNTPKSVFKQYKNRPIFLPQKPITLLKSKLTIYCVRQERLSILVMHSHIFKSQRNLGMCPSEHEWSTSQHSLEWGATAIKNAITNGQSIKA